ncbi:MAG: hypothetical protein KDA96_26035 [Planctomycetaceae bacterium]|nr:hypothetical protein [Planctomycetaceae bacterium]MCA9066564.1 hypothetical protein [Planctomycetaceae bacterium]
MHPVWRLLLMAIIFSTDHVLLSTCPADEAPLLPLTSTDLVVRIDPQTGRTETLTGVIRDVRSRYLQLQRNAISQPVTLPLRQIVELHYRKGREHEEGLLLKQQRQWGAAVQALRAALPMEPREWVQREMRAEIAQCLTQLRQHADVTSEVERIMQSDPETRHVDLLPLIWDDGRSESARTDVRPTDLSEAAVSKRLVAASWYLVNSPHTAVARTVMQDLRNSGHPQIQLLAEVQTWRLEIYGEQQPDRSRLELWRIRARDLPRPVRGPAEYLLGRGLMRLQNPEAAATCFLWLLLMSPRDPDLTSDSVTRAVEALNQSGQLEEAAIIRGLRPADVGTIPELE